MKDNKYFHLFLIVAIYLIVTVLTAQISFRDVQLRLAESLCILPMFTPIAIPGLFIGTYGYGCMRYRGINIV